MRTYFLILICVFARAGMANAFLEKVSRTQRERYLAFSALGPPFLDVAGFEKNLRLELFRTDPDPKVFEFLWRGEKKSLRFEAEEGKIFVGDGAKKNLEFSLAPLLKRLESETGNPFKIPQERLSLSVRGEGLFGRLVIYNVSARKTDGKLRVVHLKSDLLLAPHDPSTEKP